MLRQIATVLELLDRRTRWQSAGVLVTMVVLGVLEAASVGLILPLFHTVLDPESAMTYAARVGMEVERTEAGQRQFTMAVVASVVGLFVVKNALQMLIVHRMNRFIYGKQAAFVTRLFGTYLAKDYAFHLGRNSAVAIRNLTQSARLVFSNGLLPILNLAMEAMMIVAIGIVLVVAEPLGTAIVAVSLGVGAAASHRFMARRLTAWGRNVNDLVAESLKWIGQSLASIKDVKIGAKAPYFTDRFGAITAEQSGYEARLVTFVYMPRLIIEILVLAVLALVVFLFLARQAPMAEIVPILGLYGVAALRLMPSLNRALNQAAQIKVGAAAIEGVKADLRDAAEIPGDAARQRADFRFQDSVRLERITFRHQGADRPSIEDVSLEIGFGESVAIVGPSGAGKTTLVDTVIGLLRPDSGHIWVDGTAFTALPVGWDGRVGYVPQEIVLIDDTVRRNIAFGIADDQIDTTRLIRACDLANLEPVLGELPSGLDTPVGEHGKRLSGGQRQRVAIARALYAEPLLLILDEATSALDADAEQAVASAIERLAGRVTVLVIAHRLTTAKRCARLVLMRDGKVEAIGPFNTLMHDSAEFRRLVALSRVEDAHVAATGTDGC